MLGYNEIIDYQEPLDRVYATFKTTHGNITVVLFAKECPQTVWNFINLAEGRQPTNRKGPFYNGTLFSRITKDVLIMGGEYSPEGRLDVGYKFGDELYFTHDRAGILSMANEGPGTNGSAFFITLNPAHHLDGRHSVFGKVVKGMDVVQKIAALETKTYDQPVEDVIIHKILIDRKSGKNPFLRWLRGY
jgi:cyclophilin family peptidyl-prolyl cis-trans isomerase